MYLFMYFNSTHHFCFQLVLYAISGTFEATIKRPRLAVLTQPRSGISVF